MNFLRLNRRSSQTGTDRPHGLIRDYRRREGTNTQLLDDATNLLTNHTQGFTCLTLLAGLADTENRNQTARLSRSKLATHHIITLTKNQTTLGVTNEDPLATCIFQLNRSNLPGKGSLHGLYRAILGTDGNEATIEHLSNLGDVQGRRDDHHIDISRHNLLMKTFDQLCDAGAGTVHFPVTSYQRATHALPRRSKWAQMLSEVFPTSKRNQAHTSETTFTSSSA